MCSLLRKKTIDMFPITNKGYLPGDIVVHSVFSSHVETAVAKKLSEWVECHTDFVIENGDDDFGKIF